MGDVQMGYVIVACDHGHMPEIVDTAATKQNAIRICKNLNNLVLKLYNKPSYEYRVYKDQVKTKIIDGWTIISNEEDRIY